MNSQAAILDRALGTNPSGMTLDAARYFWAIHLDPVDELRANELGAKARDGSLTTDEQQEIDEYRRTGRMIEMLRIRAHSVLNQGK